MMVRMRSSLLLAAAALAYNDGYWVKAGEGETVSAGGDTGAGTAILTEDELRDLVEDMEGDDDRLVRWDVDDHAQTRQAEDGCDKLQAALNVVTATADDPNENSKSKALACEYATYCAMDNPDQRARLSEHPGIHRALVKLVSSDDSTTSALASQLIYTSAFANPMNHQGFIDAGAVEVLGEVVKHEHSEEDIDRKVTAVQIMWAAAALQNLAADYCETEDDGRCYWNWPTAPEAEHVQIDADSLPVLSDGSKAREEMLEDEDLFDALIDYACAGPVAGEESPSNPFPGTNALVGRDDENPNIIPWAAAGALKNLALLPDAAEMLEENIPCFCLLSHSPDWLEEEKGAHILHHMRRSDPCWMDEENQTVVCVDHWFVDANGQHCGHYADPTDADCETPNEDDDDTAGAACCGCGGGERLDGDDDDDFDEDEDEDFEYDEEYFDEEYEAEEL